MHEKISMKWFFVVKASLIKGDDQLDKINKIHNSRTSNQYEINQVTKKVLAKEILSSRDSKAHLVLNITYISRLSLYQTSQ